MTKYKKKTNRKTLKQKKKIDKKQKEDVRKIKRATKKKSNYNKAMGIATISKKKFDVPSKAPFAEKLIAEYKEGIEERKKQRNKDIADNLTKEVPQGEIMEEDYENYVTSHDRKFFSSSFTKFNYLVNKVVEKSDVIINVLDARDPIACISQKLLSKIKIDPNKKILFVLNKIDLIPEPYVYEWLKILKRMHPTIAFKANLQKSQKDHYADTKLYSNTVKQASFEMVNHKTVKKQKLINDAEDPTKTNTMTDKLYKEPSSRLTSILDSNKTVGLDELMNLLKNYARDGASSKVMHSITVGVLGYPNVGKSSLINSMKRSRAVSVKNTPGSTTNLQEVKIDKNVTLIDSPGVVLEGDSQLKDSLVLSAVIDYNQVDDSLMFIDKILKNKSKLDLMEELDIPDWEQKIQVGSKNNNDMEQTKEQERKENLKKIFRDESKLEHFNSDTTIKFLYTVGYKYKKFKKDGIPDLISSAKFVIHMWNEGSIKWHVTPQSYLDNSDNEMK